jgi:integrative and conjugative element protein (TIGR02256 family)
VAPGGILPEYALLGYLAEDAAVVADMFGPGPNALHGPNGFVPDAEYQEVEIARRYEASGRVVTYMGDWHSHARGLGRVSRLDLRTLHTIACEPAARVPAPIMLIVFEGDPWRLAAWIWAPIRIPYLATIPRATEIRVELFEGG